MMFQLPNGQTIHIDFSICGVIVNGMYDEPIPFEDYEVTADFLVELRKHQIIGRWAACGGNIMIAADRAEVADGTL